MIYYYYLCDYMLLLFGYDYYLHCSFPKKILSLKLMKIVTINYIIALLLGT